jgi:hypothetical protein
MHHGLEAVDLYASCSGNNGPDAMPAITKAMSLERYV